MLTDRDRLDPISFWKWTHKGYTVNYSRNRQKNSSFAFVALVVWFLLSFWQFNNLSRCPQNLSSVAWEPLLLHQLRPHWTYSFSFVASQGDFALRESEILIFVNNNTSNDSHLIFQLLVCCRFLAQLLPILVLHWQFPSLPPLVQSCGLQSGQAEGL